MLTIPWIVAVVTSSLIVDMGWMVAVLTNTLKNKTIRQWYQEFGIGAVLSDIMSSSVCVLLVTAWLPLKPTFYSILQVCSVAVGLQVIHDLSLYKLTQQAYSSKILNLFKAYGAENGASILVADASIIVSTLLLAMVLQSLPYCTVVLILLMALYILPYLVYSI